jgi:hypothetical protein
VLYFDGSDVDLSTTADEDVIGVDVDPTTGEIYLTTVGAFSVNGASGDVGDIFICTPSALGATTRCTFGPGVYWDASTYGLGGLGVDGIDLEN